MQCRHGQSRERRHQDFGRAATTSGTGGAQYVNTVRCCRWPAGCRGAVQRRGTLRGSCRRAAAFGSGCLRVAGRSAGALWWRCLTPRAGRVPGVAVARLGSLRLVGGAWRSRRRAAALPAKPSTRAEPFRLESAPPAGRASRPGRASGPGRPRPSDRRRAAPRPEMESQRTGCQTA